MSQPQLTIRRATSADKRPVLDFCSATWNGGDYIEEVWDDWFADPESALLVGALHGQPIALAHVEVQEGEAWFEGLRIAPPERGRGFGRQMLAASIVEARSQGAAVLRLLANRSNTAMQRLMAQLGFTYNFAVTWFRATAVDGPPPQPATTRSINALLADLEYAPLLRETGGLYAKGWRFVRPTRTRLMQHLAQQQSIELPGRAGWAIVMPDGESEQPTIALATGDMRGLFAALRAHPAAQAHGSMRVALPVDGAIASMARAAGYEPGEHVFGVYALPL